MAALPLYVKNSAGILTANGTDLSTLVQLGMPIE
jgi:hypothetical protein